MPLRKRRFVRARGHDGTQLMRKSLGGAACLIDLHFPRGVPMADMQSSKLPGASTVIARRDVARWLVLALAGLHPGELFGQSTTTRTPSVRQRHAEPVKFLDAATLRRIIRSARTRGEPGAAGLSRFSSQVRVDIR